MSKLTKESILHLLETNDRAVARALMVVYNNQTSDEKDAERTKHNNQIGFTGFDSDIMTNFAKFYLRKGYLSEKQIAFLRKRDSRGTMKIGKYWRQLQSAAEQKAAAKAKKS